MIITAQPFFNEIDLLEVKCRELEGEVDAHLIVESTRTFTGIKKPLHFVENAERFSNWRIIHAVCDLPEQAASPWDREAKQYAMVRQMVKRFGPEIVIWCDADEIPRAGTVHRFRRSADGYGYRTATLDMDKLLFGFDRIDISERWTNSKIGYYDPNAEPQPWRGMTGLPVLNGSGWHCEYFGQKDALLDKLRAVSHAPEAGCIDMSLRVSAGERPGMERTVDYPKECMPLAVLQEPEKYQSHFTARGQTR